MTVSRATSCSPTRPVRRSRRDRSALTHQSRRRLRGSVIRCGEGIVIPNTIWPKTHYKDFERSGHQFAILSISTSLAVLVAVSPLTRTHQATSHRPTNSFRLTAQRTFAYLTHRTFVTAKSRPTDPSPPSTHCPGPSRSTAQKLFRRDQTFVVSDRPSSLTGHARTRTALDVAHKAENLFHPPRLISLYRSGRHDVGSIC